jgi:hypothetical protein
MEVFVVYLIDQKMLTAPTKHGHRMHKAFIPPGVGQTSTRHRSDCAQSRESTQIWVAKCGHFMAKSRAASLGGLGFDHMSAQQLGRLHFDERERTP